MSIREDLDFAERVLDMRRVAELKQGAPKLPPRLNEQLLTEVSVFMKSFGWAAEGALHRVRVFNAEFSEHDYSTCGLLALMNDKAAVKYAEPVHRSLHDYGEQFFPLSHMRRLHFFT